MEKVLTADGDFFKNLKQIERDILKEDPEALAELEKLEKENEAAEEGEE